MKIFVSAAEISSDLQAEKILRALIALYPAESVTVAGIGGPRLRTLPNFHAVEYAENMRVMGFTEVLGKLLKLRKIRNQTVAFLKNFQPDLILTFDYPDFHFSLLSACREIPELKNAVRICGIPPKVWVWRAKRIEKIRKLYHAVWVLFPFEKTLYENAGIPVIYEGNPLIADALKSELPAKPVWNTPHEVKLAVMPGSRDAEIRQHLAVIPETLERLSAKLNKKILAEIPVPEGIALDRFTLALADSAQVSYRFFKGGAHDVLARNSLGLIKSGTSTLEAAVLGCVPVIFYRVSFVTRLIFQFLIRYSGAVGLPNILLGVQKRDAAIFPEFLGPEASPEALSDSLFHLIETPGEWATKQVQSRELREMLVPTSAIAERVAEKFKNCVGQFGLKKVNRKRSAWIALGSFLWSSVNAFRRNLYRMGLLKTQVIDLPSVLVGNLQAGGAGKTPLVIAIARAAVSRGFQVGVVSRGYKRKGASTEILVSSEINPELQSDAAKIGDEPAEILEAVPEVILGLGANRVRVAKLLEQAGANFLVFDDGFQNLKFKTQKTVLAVTDAHPSDRVFRDFLGAAKHADLVLQTKGLPVSAPVRAQALQWRVDALPEKPVWLLSAVGDPVEVEQFYRNLGVEIKRVLVLPDHAVFDVEKIRTWSDEAQSQGCILAVTAKDRVKLKNVKNLTVFVLKRKISSEDWLESLFKR